MKWKTPIIILLLFCFLFLPKGYAESVIVSGSGFDLYFPANSELAFQHLEDPYVISEGFTVTVMVDSGVLNGSGGSLTMWSGSGFLRFTSQNTSILSCASSSERVQINVNGNPYSNPFSISASDVVSIHWVIPAWNPILAIMGLTGLAIMIITPTYTVYQVKKKKNYIWLAYSIALFAIGYGLLVAWIQ